MSTMTTECPIALTDMENIRYVLKCGGSDPEAFLNECVRAVRELSVAVGLVPTTVDTDCRIDALSSKIDVLMQENRTRPIVLPTEPFNHVVATVTTVVSDVQRGIGAINERLSGTQKGKVHEKSIHEGLSTLCPTFRFTNVSSGGGGHQGDIVAEVSNGRRVMIELKHWTRPLAADEVTKFMRDLSVVGPNAGLLYTLGTIPGLPINHVEMVPIVTMQGVKMTIPVVYISNGDGFATLPAMMLMMLDSMLPIVEGKEGKAGNSSSSSSSSSPSAHDLREAKERDGVAVGLLTTKLAEVTKLAETFEPILQRLIKTSRDHNAAVDDICVQIRHAVSRMVRIGSPTDNARVMAVDREVAKARVADVHTHVLAMLTELLSESTGAIVNVAGKLHVGKAAVVILKTKLKVQRDTVEVVLEKTSEAVKLAEAKGMMTD